MLDAIWSVDGEGDRSMVFQVAIQGAFRHSAIVHWMANRSLNVIRQEIGEKQPVIKQGSEQGTYNGDGHWGNISSKFIDWLPYYYQKLEFFCIFVRVLKLSPYIRVTADLISPLKRRTRKSH